MTTPVPGPDFGPPAQPAPPRVPPAAPPARSGHPARLPWALVIILSVAVVALMALVAVREREIGELSGRLASDTPSASGQPSDPVVTYPVTVSPAPTGTAPSTAATPDADTAQLMISLQRRQPDDPRALGSVDAPVVLIDWSDFRCPYCAHWATTTFKELMPYVESGSLRIEFRDLVLFGEESELAAVGSRAAGQQGKFWEYTDTLFSAAPTSGHPTITRANVIAFADQAGVSDLKAFEAALDDPALLADVRKETQEAQSLGLSGTPFFLVNTTPISGAQPLEAFTSAIEGYGGKK